MLKPKIAKDSGAARTQDVSGPMQAVAGGMTRWLLMLAVSLGALGVVAGALGQWVMASTLVSIVLVAFTLYLFLKYWPEDDGRSRERVVVVQPPKPRSAQVSVMRVDGPPRARFVLALKDVVRRQDAFRLSPQGAERFARTIRFMLRNSKP